MAEGKKLGALAWVLIGCGGLLVLGGIVTVVGVYWVGKKAVNAIEEVTDNPALAAAKAVVWADRDLELVDIDEEAGTMVVHNTKTDEEIELDWSDIAEGNFRWKSSEGEVEISTFEQGDGGTAKLEFRATGSDGQRQTATFGVSNNLEDVPDWVPRDPRASDVQVGFTSRTQDAATGAFGYKTSASIADTADLYKKTLEADGYELQVTQSSGPQGEVTTLFGQNGSDGRQVTVVVTAENVAVQYSGKQ